MMSKKVEMVKAKKKKKHLNVKVVPVDQDAETMRRKNLMTKKKMKNLNLHLNTKKMRYVSFVACLPLFRRMKNLKKTSKKNQRMKDPRRRPASRCTCNKLDSYFSF
jgi:hypothetical protein